MTPSKTIYTSVTNGMWIYY